MHPKCRASLTTWVLLMFVMWMCTSAMAGFAEIPANVTVELETATPPCRCRHMTSDADIFWRVNGSPSGLFPDIRSGSENESGTIVYTLTIPAEPQYNGTVVECVAVFFDGSLPELSPPATIFFSAPTVPLPEATHSLPETTQFEMTPTNTPPGITENPTNTPPGTTNFVITPSPLTVAVEQGTATFQCQHPLAVSIGWKVNGIPLSVATLQNISMSMANDVMTLSIGTLLVYNGISIECQAKFFDGSSPQFTAPVTLLIQDTPEHVKNTTLLREYSNNKLMALWNPLPTLDITDTDPDILYTVELYQITCGQNILLYRTEVGGSNVTEEGLDLMQIYKAVIAARNNVRGARNGPSIQMKEIFMSLNGTTLLNLARNTWINIQSGAPAPSYYEMTLVSLDGREDLVTNITVERNGEMIDMHVEENVPPNSLWRASILAYGCESHRIVTNYELSTHDIQNIVASSELNGQISVTGELISGATATGVLVVVYSLTDQNNIHYIAKQTEKSRISLNVTGLTGAEYGVSIFALENGLPLPSVVTSPKNVTIYSQDRAPPQQPLPIQYYGLIRTTYTGVCITCIFLESSTTNCVVVVHQQLSSSGLMNIESSHKFTRSGDTAYGCIEGVNLEQYQVGVIGGRMFIEPNNKTMDTEVSNVKAITVGTVLGVVVFTVIVAVMVILFVAVRIRLKRSCKLMALDPEPVYNEVTPRTGSQAHTIVNIDSGSRPENDYAESAGPAQDQPLLTETPPLPPRLMADGESTPLLHNVLGDPTYTPVLTTTPNAVSQPAATEKIRYEDIQKYRNKQGQDYALPQFKVTSKKGPVDDLHQVVYTEIKPHSIIQTGDQNIDSTSDRPATPQIPSRETAVCEPVTTEQLFSFLHPHASKWQSLGIALSLDEDRLDEVYTNNEREEDCLREMLELYMMRSDLDHSWEEVHTALEKIKSSRDGLIATSVQEVNSSQNSPMVGGETILVLNMDADSHPDKQAAIGEESNDREEEETSSEELPESNEKNSSTLNPLSENLQDKQGESSDSGYGYSQQSESESSENSVALEMEDDSTSLSQAVLDERLEPNEKNGPIPFLSDLEEYESRADPSFGSQPTLTDNGEFGRTTIDKLPMPPPSAPINSCSPGLQLERFCEQPEDEENNDELCKIKPVHCQDSCIHDNYHEALIRQMGLLTDHKAWDKLEHNNAVEESPLVHTDSEQESKSLDMDFCTPKTFPALDIPKVHELVPQCFFVSPKYSHLLMLTTIQLENDQLITLYFACVILSVVYSSKLYAIINVCSVKVHVRVNID